ncbi:MAG TPA: acetyl-CoA carboxylase biotin carboxylase subunit [Candidatus Eisenbacteria bacterium]|nr:acetyl-CoA carboxylase biotin carboxylase subunit [Candidatus Eisenbacteria bacterium]
MPPSEPRPFRRVLVANRGEIAVRVIRTLRDLGMTSIAVYSEADRAALHVLLADEAYPVGPAAASQSYLDVERLLEAARRSRAEAVHPGYGFLSENADFAAACESAGLVFIGPPAASIRLMGNKLAARELARKVGAPLVPGSPGPVDSPEQARAEAEHIGFPILLKAAAGGGGKGMRVVRDAAGLTAAFELVRGEAKTAFGDEQVYLERYLEHPRHIEAQVLADASGHVLFLGERECSVQRRHQKVLEETPSPALPPNVRAQIGDAACAVAQAAGYRNAGTVEFIVDEKDRFYFLEMNTRLQVEHPVTEMVTGLDLVAEQIRIAQGEPLGFDPAEATPRGASVEVRVYAEDPRRGFLPATGTVARLRWPLGPGVRVDSGIYRGYTVPVHYDPILAKIVSWGRDRAQALARLGRALDETVLHGVTTNVGFHRWLVRHPVIAAGRYDTRFLEEQFRPEMLEGDAEAERVALIAASLHEWQKSRSVSLPRRREGGAWKWAGVEGGR